MKLKVTIEKDGISYDEELVVSEGLAPLFIIKSIENTLIAAELMHKDDRLEILGSDESALLSKSGY